MTRIQVQPYCPFGGDVSWITQEMLEGYIFAWIKGDRFAKAYIAKYAQGDPGRIQKFIDVTVDDSDFDDLKEQIWAELELPETGSIEYHIWQIERQLADPLLPKTELAKLYKVLGEYRGWITKPGEGKVQVNVGAAATVENMSVSNPVDAERMYASVIASM
jgi:hypothetical protein